MLTAKFNLKIPYMLNNKSKLKICKNHIEGSDCYCFSFFTNNSFLIINDIHISKIK